MQSWEVKAPSSAEAFEWRKFLRDQGANILQPLLEKAFDEAAGEDRLLRLKRLELKIRVQSPEQLAERLPELLRQELSHRLQGPDASGGNPASAESRAPEDTFEMLVQYLHTGSLCWEAQHLAAHERTVQLSEACGRDLNRLLGLLREQQVDAAFCFRLLQLLSPTQAASLAGGIVADLEPQLRKSAVLMMKALLFAGAHPSSFTQLQTVARVLEKLSRLARSGADAEVVRRGLQELVEVYIASAPRQADNAAARTAQPAAAWSHPAVGTLDRGSRNSTFTAEIPMAPGNESEVLPEASVWLREGSGDGKEVNPAVSRAAAVGSRQLPPWWRPEAEMPLVDNVAAEFEYDLKKAVVTPRQSDPPNAVPESVVVARPEPGTSHGYEFNRDMKKLDAANTGSQLRVAPKAEWKRSTYPLLVPQGGLVLLHPFLPRYLGNCGVLDANGSFTSSAAALRGAALLHFLATGRVEIFEHELGMEKVLLGLAPETALPVCQGLLTESDRDEAEAVLQSAISYWSVLQNTSTSGFRSSFLQRHSLLREDESGWKLQVERKGYDMLLEHLPWSFGIVKLPWMKKPVYTEW